MVKLQKGSILKVAVGGLMALYGPVGLAGGDDARQEQSSAPKRRVIPLAELVREAQRTTFAQPAGDTQRTSLDMAAQAGARVTEDEDNRQFPGLRKIFPCACAP